MFSLQADRAKIDFHRAKVALHWILRACVCHPRHKFNKYILHISSQQTGMCTIFRSSLQVYLWLGRPELTCVSGSVLINQLLLFNEALKLQETHRFAGAFTPSLPIIKANPHHRRPFRENADLFFLIVSFVSNQSGSEEKTLWQHAHVLH